MTKLETFYKKNDVLCFWFKSFSDFLGAVGHKCNYSLSEDDQMKAAEEILRNIID